jgi:hypothetical protein
MKLIPKYAQIKIPINNEAAKKTLSQTHTLRIKNEIKFLYKKKQSLNIQLYHIHIYNANIWQQIWNNIEQSINQKLQVQMKTTTENRKTKTGKQHNTK